MDMVGQDNPGVDLKGPLLPDLAHSRAKAGDLLRQQIAAPLREVDGKIDASARQAGAKIIGHHPKLPNPWLTKG